MYSTFSIAKDCCLCVRDKRKDSTFIVPTTYFLVGSISPFLFFTSTGVHEFGYVEDKNGVKYLHMELSDDQPKFGLLTTNRSFDKYMLTSGNIIEDFSIEDSEIGNLSDIKDMVIKAKSEDDLLFYLRLAIPILHKYSKYHFYDLLAFQNVYNLQFNAVT